MEYIYIYIYIYICTWDGIGNHATLNGMLLIPFHHLNPNIIRHAIKIKFFRWPDKTPYISMTVYLGLNTDELRLGHGLVIIFIIRHRSFHLQLHQHFSLRWCHNGHDGVSNHQPQHCLPNRLCGCRSKKTSKLRVTGLWAENSLDPPLKWPVTRKMFPFDDVVMH